LSANRRNVCLARGKDPFGRQGNKMAKAKMILLVMKQEGVEIVRAELKEAQAKKIVQAYKAAGEIFQAEYKAVAA
jgi:hypothetical protein